MFIAFIQKKGWLKFDDAKGQDYFNALWSDYVTGQDLPLLRPTFLSN